VQYTTEQQAVIQHSGGHARIIAVAGSGKTQTLTAYVNQRLQQGADPRRMLVLMYNKAAQLDFERRLRTVVSARVALPDVRTFHSLGYRICQTLVQRGYMASFDKNILQDSEIEPVIWRILRSQADADIADDILTKKKKWVEPALAYIELVKSSLATPEQVFESTGLPASCRLFVSAFYEFEDWRSQQRKMTFSDLLYEPVLRFRSEPEIAAQFAGHMAEYIVDEFQDINPVQSFLLQTLHGGKGDVMVVGDPDQTIYEFRGSDPALLTTGFSHHYRSAKDYHLSHTFRFGDCLSLLANQVIAGNYSADVQRTQCVSHHTAGETVVMRKPSADSAQAALDTIRHWQSQRPLKDIAVINRLWANSARLELLLLANAIAYHMDNQQTVLERYELRPFRVLLQIAGGQLAQWDKKARRQAWQVLLTQPYLKIKKNIVDELIAQLSSEPDEWGRALRNSVPKSISKFQSEQLFERARWIEKAERGVGGAATVLSGWLQGTDYLASLKDNAFSVAQVDDQIATVKAFVSFVCQSRWSLASGSDRLDELMNRKTPANADALLITSIHKSKGRQWPCVLIPELNNQFFPYQPEGEMMISTSVASERRLLYVAMTRAIEHLVLLTPSEESNLMPSRLLPDAYVDGLLAFEAALKNNDESVELPGDMHQASVESYARIKGIPSVRWQKKAVRASDELLDQVVAHPKLGVGQIIRETDTRITIRFVRHGEREFDKQIVLPLLEPINTDE
jgi:DNA helicase-2/ATP-dependent DNA helicase PcrA